MYYDKLRTLRKKNALLIMKCNDSRNENLSIIDAVDLIFLCCKDCLLVTKLHSRLQEHPLFSSYEKSQQHAILPSASLVLHCCASSLDKYKSTEFNIYEELATSIR